LLLRHLPRVSDDLVPVAVLRAQPLEPRVTPVDRRQAVRLADRDDAQPREDRIALGLTADEDHRRRLAGVLDELARRSPETRATPPRRIRLDGA
jgi:hypothetical protein